MGEKKSLLLTCLKEQYDTWKEAADGMNLSLSAWIRLMADAAVGMGIKVNDCTSPNEVLLDLASLQDKVRQRCGVDPRISARNKKRNRITEEVLRDIEERYSNGETQTSIADRYDVTQGYISYLVGGQRTSVLSELDVPNIERAIDDGVTYASLSRHYGVSVTTIKRFLVKYGIDR